MKSPAPNKTGIAEYKHTTRKKYLQKDVTRKEWALIQRKNLPAFRGLEFLDWPVDRILDERVSAKNNRLEYLVQWEDHPIKKATWKPEWLPAKQVGTPAIEEWKIETRKRRTSHAGVLDRQSDDLGAPTSSIEIAETQQDPSPRPDVSVEVPPATVDLNDYESLHSSQLRSSGGAFSQEVSSPAVGSGKVLNRLAQRHIQHSPLAARSSLLHSTSSQQPTSSDDIIRPRPTRLRKSLVERGNKRSAAITQISSNSNHHSTKIRSPPKASSPSSRRSFPAPDYVASTQGNSKEKTLVHASATDSLSSPWEFQTQAPARPPTAAFHDSSLSDTVLNSEELSRIRESSTRSSSSYHSAKQPPGPHSPLSQGFFVRGSPFHRTSSSTSSLEADLALDSIESDALPAGNMDATGGSALPIQNSIEDEEPSSNGAAPHSSDSKGSSSQQSLDNEREVPQIAGLVEPSLPILGQDEYAITLPCEGKIQSTYSDIIKAKDKSIKKFLSRHESIGSANGSPNRTHERNEMNELVQLLHDTVTHMDLGLGGFAATQYSINSQEHAVYANYAGSKFSFLGYLVDMLKVVGLSIIVMSRQGQIQDLVEQYLKMKHVVVKRQDRVNRSNSPAPNRVNTDFQVDVISTWSTHAVDIRSRPCLMIAFDASFDSQDPQVARIRAKYERYGRLMPVVHLLVANSSEHVERCLPKALPSPIRLKALVRYTYRALPNLGGRLRWLRQDSDVPEDRPMDLSDLQRGLRKSPERRLHKIADMVGRAAVSPDFATAWTLGITPALELTDVDETPSSKPSRAVTRPDTPRDISARSRTPTSRAGTPSGRKRMLDVDGMLPALVKRQRLTPLRDSMDASSTTNEPSTQSVQLQDLLKKLQADLATEKEARRAAEQERDRVNQQLDEWKRDHMGLQRRYEKRMTKCHDLDKEKTRLLKTIENNKTRQERSAEDNIALKQKTLEMQKELTLVREELKTGDVDLASLEIAREAARTLATKNTMLEKSLENTRKDFEFTRSQYQNASNKATELAGQVSELEKENTILSKQASDEKRRLRAINFEQATSLHLGKIASLEMEVKSRDLLLKKVEEENRQVKRNRGVQTRGSSVQPPGSPGLDGHGGRGTRSRQGSPAPGLFPTSHRGAERGSLLRNER